MTGIDWFITSVSSATLLAIVAWFSRHLILTRLKSSVQHEFNEKLETLRTDLRRSEESFKADLRAKEDQIQALRSGALSALASRQAALDKRRLEGIEQLWDGIEKLAPAKVAASFMSTIRFEKSVELAAKDSRVRELFATIGKGCEPDKFLKIDAYKARPFVTEMAWALYAAYRAMVIHAVAQVYILQVGIDDPKILNTEQVQGLVKTTLPAYTAYVDKFGPAGYYNLLEPLEAELLKELQRMMRGEESDKVSVEQAAKIMKEVVSVNEAISKGSAAAQEGRAGEEATPAP